MIRLSLCPSLCGRDDLSKANSVDLRLGSELILMRRGELATLDFDKDLTIDLHRFYEVVFIGVNERFVLHPRELVLGATLEYVVLPQDLMAYIIGRSSWGRLGLIIATATVIHPGYRGCPTLELLNTGNIPIQLFPGGPIPVAQLVFHAVGPGQLGYAGRYSLDRWVGPTGPGYSRIDTDDVFKKWIMYLKSQRGVRKSADV